jgi:hypothetical protein
MRKSIQRVDFACGQHSWKLNPECGAADRGPAAYAHSSPDPDLLYDRFADVTLDPWTDAVTAERRLACPLWVKSRQPSATQHHAAHSRNWICSIEACS